MVGDFKCGARELDPRWRNQAMFDGIDNNCNGRIDFGAPPVKADWENIWKNEMPTPGIGTTSYIDAEMHSKVTLSGTVRGPDGAIDATLTVVIADQTHYFERDNSIFRKADVFSGWNKVDTKYFSTQSGSDGKYELILNKNFTYFLVVNASPVHGVEDKTILLSRTVDFDAEDYITWDITLLDSALASLCTINCTIDGKCREECNGYNNCHIISQRNSLDYCEGFPPGIVFDGAQAIFCCSGRQVNLPRATPQIDSAHITTMLVTDMRTIIHRIPAVLKMVVYN